MTSDTPAKRSRPFSTKSNPSKKQKHAKNQLLISRFFTSSSSAVPPSPATKPTTVPTAAPTTPSTSKSPNQPKAEKAEKAKTPIATTDDIEEQKDRDQNLNTQLTEHKPSDDDHTSSPPITRATRSKAVLKKIPLRNNRRRMLIIDDVDEESDVEAESRPRRAPTSPSRSHSPSFAPSHSSASDDADLDDIANIDEDEKPTQNSDVEEDVVMDESSPHPPVTLSSYTRKPTTDNVPAVALPRDPKRRAQFTNKVGRLERNSLFLKYTGGTGDPGSTTPQPKSCKPQAVKHTPLETQFVQLRKQNPGMLLLIECGYKYRMFDEDATAASRTLRVAAYFDHNFLTASFPTHRLAHHVRRLVDAGHKVGLVSQSETAALKKATVTSSKLFTRRLSAVYTKATIAADGLLQPSKSAASVPATASYVLAVREVRDDHANTDDVGIAIAAVDCATGLVFYDAFRDDLLRSQLESRLVAIEPVELLTTHTRASTRTEGALSAYCENSKARMERVKDSQFARHDGIALMNQKVEAKLTAKSLLCDGVLSCLGSLFEYLKTFQLQLSMSGNADYNSLRSARHMKVGADVLTNFEVFGNSANGSATGSVIGLVNRTKTAFGSRLMRRWVSQPLVNGVEIRERLDAVEFLQPLMSAGTHGHACELKDGVVRLISTLPDVPDLEQAFMRIACGKCSPREVLAVLNGVTCVATVTDHIRSLVSKGGSDTQIGQLLTRLFGQAPDVDSILHCAVVKALNVEAAVDDRLHELFIGSEEDGTVGDLLSNVEEAADFLECLRDVDEAKEELQQAELGMTKLLEDLKQEYGCPKWEWKKVAQEEYVIEVSLKKAGSIPGSWTVVSQTKSVKRFRPGAAVEGYDRVLRARELRDAAGQACWKQYVDLFHGVGQRLSSLVRMIGELDCLCAFGHVANLPGYCKPTVEDRNASRRAGVSAVNARHALSEALPSCRSYVCNDVNLGGGSVNEDGAKGGKQGAPRAIVISGPNYGGKSSYARMTGLLILLAQMGCYVPADSMRLCPFDGLFARMGASDCMAKGMSSLMVELADTSRILKAATRDSCVVVDELGRGTSTHDGAAIAFATLSHFVAQLQCVSLFVTHYPMIGGLQDLFPGLVKACFMDYREEENGCADKKTITLLYKLTSGIAPSSYGVNVARLAGIDDCVLSDALEKATFLEGNMQRKQEDDRFASLLTTDVSKLLAKGR